MKISLRSMISTTIVSAGMMAVLMEPALAQQQFAIPTDGIAAGQIAENIADSGKGFAKLAEVGALVLGLFMMLIGILKFKAYKDNPQQTPLGTPVTLILIAVALIAIPSMFGSGLQTLFGGSAATVQPW